MINSNIQDEARRLALRPYSLFVFLDETTDGDTIYVATNLELPGCTAQGETVEEAEAILTEVRIDYMAHRLANNLPIPEPNLPRPVNRTPDAKFGYRIVEPDKADKGESTADLNMLFAAAYA